MRPCRRAWRRSCRLGPCPCRGLTGTCCPAGGRGSSPPLPAGRRRSSRRGAWPASRARSATSRDPSCAPLLRLLSRLLRRLGLGPGLRRAPGGLFADRLDLDLREAAPEAGVPPIALLRAVFPDPDFVAEDVLDDARGDLDLRLQVRLAVPAQEEERGMERLALVRLDAVDEQPFALADAVLLATHRDDRVALHLVRTRARARERSV